MSPLSPTRSIVVVLSVLSATMCSIGVANTATSAAPIVEPVLLQMVRDATVQRELKLTSAQVDQVREATSKVDGDWFRSRNLPTEKQLPVIAGLTRVLRGDLDSFLNDSQLVRLAQLERQALGTRMVTIPEVQAKLDLTNSQIDRFEEVFLKTDADNLALQKKIKAKEIKGVDAARALSEIKKAELDAIVGSFTDSQKGKLGSLTGKPFDFSQVTRSLPSAPDIVGDGVTWIQGGQQDLSELRGKVVAVHFYAFQCINCIRNLPHYTAWHNDYADKGLVVIGLQTPETSAERSLEKVSAAVAAEEIKYPVALDGDSSNWKNWGTTMWPSVYLIDKEGYLRKWWYGEMNWQGYEGEQEMRDFIEKLLAE